ncbi:MAG: amidohydrolase, partial [Candidatus Eremiobacteraeota bacterium]|nr:amidohydrolase [Candidatus Eremiobacteraeota bacterium]
DGHTAILLATARQLARISERLHGQVRLVFQPAEEGPGGAEPMIREGVLEGVDLAIGLHLWANLPTGQATVCSGPMMASTDEIEIVIEGTGAHAALPHQGIDPILVGAQLVTAIQSIVSRNLDPLDSAAVSITKFHGGEALNVIAPEVRLGGTVRTFRDEVRQLVKQRLQGLIDGLCAAHGATGKLRYREGYPSLINDAEVTARVEKVCRDVLELPELLPDPRTLGGEDMAYYLREVPGCFFFLGAANPAKNACYGHHHPRFDIDEEALPLGVEILLRLVEDYLSP